MASFAVSPASPEASKSSLLRKTCPSLIGSKSTGHNHSVEVLVANAPPLILAVVRVENLALRTPGGSERRNPQRLNRLHRRRNDRANRHRANRWNVNRATAQRLHFTIDTTTGAGGLAFRRQQQRKSCGQQRTHARTVFRLSPRPALRRLTVPTIASRKDNGCRNFLRPPADRITPNPHRMQRVPAKFGPVLA